MAELGDTEFETAEQRDAYRALMEKKPCASCDADTREMLRALDVRDQRIAQLEMELANLRRVRHRRSSNRSGCCI